MGMDERKYRILQAIIDDYILTAEPVKGIAVELVLIDPVQLAESFFAAAARLFGELYFICKICIVSHFRYLFLKVTE